MQIGFLIFRLLAPLVILLYFMYYITLKIYPPVHLIKPYQFDGDKEITFKRTKVFVIGLSAMLVVGSVVAVNSNIAWWGVLLIFGGPTLALILEVMAVKTTKLTLSKHKITFHNRKTNFIVQTKDIIEIDFNEIPKEDKASLIIIRLENGDEYNLSTYFKEYKKMKKLLVCIGQKNGRVHGAD